MTGAADARAAFLLGLSNGFKEDFQDSSWTNAFSLATARPLSFSDGVNTLAGTYTIQSSGGGTTSVQVGVPAANNWGDFQGLATNPASTNKWIGMFSPTVTISLNPGQSAIGFFLNDVRDQQARNVTVSWADGNVTSVLLGANSGLLGNQNLYFVGMKSASAITSVVISGASSSDGIALDEIIRDHRGLDPAGGADSDSGAAGCGGWFGVAWRDDGAAMDAPVVGGPF